MTGSESKQTPGGDDMLDIIKKIQGTITDRLNEARQLQKDKPADQGVQQRRLRDMRQEMAEMRQRLQETEEKLQEKTELQAALERIQELEAQLEEQEAAPTGMAAGNPAWVRKAGGQGLNRRDAPGLNSTVMDSLSIGTQVTLLEGPHPADGYTWWRVRVSDGREGWVAGEELVTSPE